jgi:nitrite reductase/ring-hydroxylating ferredoxin subunit
MSETGNWVRVAGVADVDKGSMIGVELMGLNLAVYHLASGEFCVTDNLCTHAYALLTEGWLEDNIVECPLHAGGFDVRTGKGQGAPIEQDLKTFPVRVQGDDIMIGLPE